MTNEAKQIQRLAGQALCYPDLGTSVSVFLLAFLCLLIPSGVSQPVLLRWRDGDKDGASVFLPHTYRHLLGQLLCSPARLPSVT